MLTSHALAEQLPFNLVVALGSYCLWELGMGVLTFGECGDAHEELRGVRHLGIWGSERRADPRLQEIKEATDDLRAKGVSVD